MVTKMRLRILSLFAIMVFAGFGVAQTGKQVPIKNRAVDPVHNKKVLPVDQAAKDPTFKAFRNELLEAARRKDKEYILSILDPKIQLSFGGHSGIKDFKEMWKIDQPNSEFWNELITILELGGAFQTIESHKDFVAPYVTSQWPDDARFDPFEYVAIIGKNVRLRSAPGIKAPQLASLSNDIVKLITAGQPSEPPNVDGFRWVKVKTGSGVQGFVADKYIRSPIDYRAYFKKIKGQWRMTVFLAGD